VRRQLSRNVMLLINWSNFVPTLNGGIIHPLEPGKVSGSPRRSWALCWRDGCLGFPLGPVTSLIQPKIRAEKLMEVH